MPFANQAQQIGQPRFGPVRQCEPIFRCGELGLFCGKSIGLGPLGESEP